MTTRSPPPSRLRAQVADPVWRLPFWKPYERSIEGRRPRQCPVRRHGRRDHRALFLRRFVAAARPWVHLDIYGWTPAAKPGRSKGGAFQAARASSWSRDAERPAPDIGPRRRRAPTSPPRTSAARWRPRASSRPGLRWWPRPRRFAGATADAGGRPSSSTARASSPTTAPTASPGVSPTSTATSATSVRRLSRRGAGQRVTALCTLSTPAPARAAGRGAAVLRLAERSRGAWYKLRVTGAYVPRPHLAAGLSPISSPRPSASSACPTSGAAEPPWPRLLGAGPALALCHRQRPRRATATCRRAASARRSEPRGRLRRGDLVFWPGHVAIVRDPDTLIHANGYHMATDNRAHAGRDHAHQGIRERHHGDQTIVAVVDSVRSARRHLEMSEQFVPVLLPKTRRSR